MPTARSLSRPTRRSLLLAGAVLAPLGLAGCDPEGGEGTEEEPPPRATVTLAPMATSEALLPTAPVRVGSWNVSPTSGHPVAMLVSRVLGRERDLWVLTLENPGGVQVPIDSLTTSVTVEGHGRAVQVLAETVAGAELRQVLWRSEDLESWSETDLGTAIDRRIAAFGDGIVVSQEREGTLSVWEVGADASVTTRTPITAADGQEGKADDVARAGSTIRVLVTSTDAEGVERPGLVSSEDGGGTWSALQLLPVTGESTVAHSIRALEEEFVIIGRHEVALDWEEGRTQWRPTAWSIGAGNEPVQEEIPLPTFGVNNWKHSVRGDLDAGTPIDWTDITGSVPVAELTTGQIHCAVFQGDDCRRATRSRDGHWSVSGVDPFVPFIVSTAVASTVGQILLSDAQAVSRRGGSEAFAEGLSFSAERSFHRSRHGVVDGLDAVLSSSRKLAERNDEHFSSSTEYTNQGLSILDEHLGPAGDLPEAAQGWQWPVVHHPRAGMEILTGRTTHEDDFLYHLAAQVRLDGEWAEVEGLELSALTHIGNASETDGVLYLPTACEVDGEPGLGGIVVHTSEDGIRWAKRGSLDTSVAEQEEFSGRAYINVVVAVEGAVIGIGEAHDGEDVSRAATFLLQGETWVPRLIADAQPDTSLDAASLVGGTMTVTGRQGDRMLHGELAADGTVTQTWLSTEQELRSTTLDLGDGALLAGGWLDRAPAEGGAGSQTGHGACVWASHDAGRTWTATLLPDHEGRFPGVHLAEDGEDVVVLAVEHGVPRAYRIVGARSEVLAAVQ